MENWIMMPEVKEPERQESKNKQIKRFTGNCIISAIYSIYIFHKNYWFTKKSLEENLNRKWYSYFHQIKHSQAHNYIVWLGSDQSEKVILIDKNNWIETEYDDLSDLKNTHKYWWFIFTRVSKKIFGNIA